MSSSSSPSRRTTVAGLAAVAGTGLVAAPAGAATPSHGRRGRPLIGRARRDRIHLMSFNIRYDREGTAPTSPDHWPTRRPALTSLLRTEQPTLLGVQEAEYNQLPAIESALPRHRMIGYGRSGGSKGEYSSIFYDADRLEVLEWDQRWLSDTPDVIGSATWSNTVTRVVTWARLRDRSRRELVHVNTHLDHKSEEARRRSAEVISGLRETFAGLPVLVTGDFNAHAEASEPYRVLVTEGPYEDTWLTARRRLTPAWGTFPNYEDPVEGGPRIDWVLTTPGVRVHEAAVNTSTPRGVWPSDHTPVQALLSL